MTDHTFVIPVYKESPHLEACIQSLIAQTMQSKIIITTSTPSAYSKRIAGTYNIPYYTSNLPTGIANDWNFALSKCDTKYGTIAHQYDIYEPFFAELSINQLNKTQAAIAFTGYADIVKDSARKSGLNVFVKGCLLFPFFFNPSIQNRFIKKMILLFGDPICCPSVTFNKQVLTDFGFPTNYECALDWYAWYQLAQNPGAFVYIKQKLIRHRIHTGSETTNQLNTGIRQLEELRLFELMWGKTFARIIAKIYALGHRDNVV